MKYTNDQFLTIQITRQNIPKNGRKQIYGSVPKYTTELNFIIYNPYTEIPKTFVVGSEIKNKNSKKFIIESFANMCIPRPTEFYNILQHLYYIISISLGKLLVTDRLEPNSCITVAYRYYPALRRFEKIL